ncbi:MAG: Txe/YoeB family addiction module toxin [Gemmatimonadetes bacterium]|nr:Txe/YoeB family addiction module toxin [Gemmatimonadota bacterium]
MTVAKLRAPIFDPKFMNDLMSLGRSRKQLARRTLELVAAACQDHARGPGNPEPLSHNWSGYWSRRINQEHRLIYRLTNGEIEFCQAKGHY